MKHYLSIDGGGSKCVILHFDEDFRILGFGISGGVNTTQNSPESSRANMVESIEMAFANGVPAQIDMVFGLFVGPFDVMLEELNKRTRVLQSQRYSEPRGCRIAAALRGDGLLALSGTGSDVFYLKEEEHFAVGGWGPILGDQGSGAWMGMQALQAAVMAWEGWGPQTKIWPYLLQQWDMKELHEAIRIVHRDPAPLRRAAQATRAMARAAAEGDEVALGIAREAGALLAKQLICLMERHRVPAQQKEIAYVGGGWKVHPEMAASFEKHMQAYRSDLYVVPPLFEPLMMGPILVLQQQQPDMARDRQKELLLKHFPDYRYGM